MMACPILSNNPKMRADTLHSRPENAWDSGDMARSARV